MTTVHHHDWSSLPADLVNRVADCLLSTNDLDWYMYLRAVCHNWRAATADPRASSPGEPRFRPRCWVTLDEDKSHQSREDDGTRLFVNTATGRFLRRRLQHVHGGYYLVTSTPGGFLVLAERSAPHAAMVVNPFTGAMMRFVAPVPCEASLTAAVVSGGGGSADQPTLVLACNESRKVYWAGPEREAFLVDTCPWRPSGLLPCMAALYAARMHGGSAVADTDVDDPEGSSVELKHRTYAVASTGGEILVVDLMGSSHSHGVQVYKKGEGVLEQVTSIGNHALFVGDRCLLVDADKLPSVEPNCVYYQLQVPDESLQYAIFMYDLNTGKAERIGIAASTNPLLMPDDQPLTLIQLLVNYTMHVPCDKMVFQRMCQGIPADLGSIHSVAEDFGIYFDDDDEFEFSD